MSAHSPNPEGRFVTHEPKFCKCRVCHEYFYADTVEQARVACLAHAGEAHPDWGASACYCPD